MVKTVSKKKNAREPVLTINNLGASRKAEPTSSLRRPGRPRSDGRPPITKRQVLAAAAELIVELGFGDTSIRMIANRLGTNASSVFYHFPTKDQILDELVSELFRSERLFVQQIIELDLEPDVALYKLVYEDLLVCAENNVVLQRIFLLPDLRSGRFPLAAELWNELVSAYASTIAIGQKRGIFIACDRRAAAEGLYTFLSTPLIGFDCQPKPGAKVLASTLAIIGVRGILKDPSRIETVVRDADAIDLAMRPPNF